MKRIIKSLPAWLKVLIYFGVLGLATMIAGTVPALNDFLFFVLVAAGLSQVFLWANDQSLRSLHSVPTNLRHWQQLGYGTIAGCLMLLITALVTIALTGDQWHVNSVDPVVVLITFITCLWSAFAQEFVFRGYPFQALNDTYGKWQAQLFIAIPFGLMHLNSSISLREDLLTMLTTGLGSVLFGLAYLKTRHLALSIGLHLGWNFAQALVPRTAGAKGPTLIAISGDPDHYKLITILGPFVVVVIIAILLLSLISRQAPILPERL